MMKKILFIISSLNGGGAEKALVELLKHFDYTRYEVTLCVLFHDGIYFDSLPPQVRVVCLWPKMGEGGYWINSVRRKAFRQFSRHGSTRLFRWTLYFRFGLRRFDVIVSYLEGYPLLFHSLLHRRANRNISWVHCDLYNYHWSRDAFPKAGSEEHAYGLMDDIVFVSNNVLHSFVRLFPRLKVPLHCIYNVVDVGAIRNLAKRETITHAGFTVIAVGSLIPVKGFDRLLRVARLFKDKGYDLHFQILGSGNSEQELKDLSRSLNVEDCVEFLGFQSSPYPYVAAADVLVSTSHSEAFSLVICEALSLGVPVVATRTAGASEVLDGGKYGILVEQDDNAVFEGIRRLADDEEVCLDYRNRACERAEFFRVESAMGQVYDLLDRTVPRKHSL